MTAPRLHQVLVSPRVGGAAVVAMRLASAAKERNLPVRAWVPGSGAASQELERLGLPWRSYDLEAMRRSHPAHLWACARMAPGLIGPRGRPVVHVHNPTVYRLIRPTLAACRARAVVHFHIEPTREEITWSLQHLPDHIVTCAHYIAEKILAELPELRSAARVTAVPNAIDVERFTPTSQAEARRRVGLETTRFVLLMMANLSPHKGQETTLRAAQILAGRGMPVECWLAGEDRAGRGAYEQELRRLAVDLGLADAVKFLGFRSDGPDLLRAADALLLPSTHEGLPLTILEAQAAGVPVVASTIPGVLEVVEHERTGLTIPAGDFKGYANAIASLYDNGDFRRQLTDAAATQVRRAHSWTTYEARMFEIYGALSPPLGRV